MRADELANCKEPSELTSEELAMSSLHLPSTFCFTIHKSFRIFFCTSNNVPKFPITFARMCTKVSLELPTQIKLNVIKTLNGQTN